MALRVQGSSSFVDRQSQLRAIGKKELKLWEAALEKFSRSKTAHALREPRANYSDYRHFRMETISEWDTAVEERVQVQAASMKLVHALCARYFSRTSQILEIGSNLLDENGLSYLAFLLPQQLQQNLSYSDYIPSVVEEEAPKTRRPFHCVDLRSPDPSLFESQDGLIAINVADVISRHELGQFASGAHQLLRSGGHCLILADRPIDLIPLLAKFSQAESCVFPYIEESPFDQKFRVIQGVKVTPVEKVEQELSSLGVKYTNFFNKLAALTAAQRQCFLRKSFFKGLSLCNFLDLLTANSATTLQSIESYRQDVTAAFETHHFETLFANLIEVSVTIPHPDLGFQHNEGKSYNRLIYHQRHGGLLHREFSFDLPSNQLEVRTAFHVMIFKKN